MTRAERILVIDDQQTQREKVSLAVRNLGFGVESAADGAKGLALLKQGNFDLVLLDIMMPGMNGFEVMEFIKQDPSLVEIPVIVISALDSEMSAVVKAIEFGAQDFLPKQFDAVLLRARINSSLEKRRNRVRELEHLRQVQRLTDAASVLENGIVDPRRLQIDDIARRDDALGKLAGVFTRMAGEIYERETRLRQQIRTLRSTGILVGVGVVSGLGIVLSRIAAEAAAHPFGIALWVNVIVAILCLANATYRGVLPRINKNLIYVLMLWAVFATVIAESTIFWVAQHLQASTIALIVAAEGFLVFAFASLIRIETANTRRLLGFLIGFAGVAMVIATTTDQNSASPSWMWASIALLAPIGYAFRTLLITVRLPTDVDMVAATGYCSVLAVVTLIPIVILTNDFFPLTFDMQGGGGILVLAIFLFGVVSSVGVSMRVGLIRSAGGVFASQSSFVVTFAGIVWGILLLGESVPLIGWVALLMLIAGLLLVGPKEEAEGVEPIVILDGSADRLRLSSAPVAKPTIPGERVALHEQSANR